MVLLIIENIRKFILTGVISDDVPNELLTSVISAQSLLRTIITALLALLFGVIADAYGIGVSFIVVSSVLIALTFFVNNFIKDTKV